MKKSILFLCMLLGGLFVSGQPDASPGIPVRQDTIIWEVADSLPVLLLQAIEKGKVKAMDHFSGEQIPAAEIYTWRMVKDTVARYDSDSNIKYEVVQSFRKPEAITRLRIMQSWYWDTEKSRLYSRVSWMELLEEVYDASGSFRAYRPLCRIYYYS